MVKSKLKSLLLVVICGIVGMGATYSCSPLILDNSALALEAGQATMILGSCQRGLSVGYDACWFERGAELPKLQLAFTNPAEYAVSDCQFGIYETGSVSEPGVVEIDLAPLSTQLYEMGFCLLRVEAKEYFPEPNDPNQQREIPLVGGWFREMFDRGYNPTPADPMVAWCYKVRRTTAGRTTVEDCE